MSKRESCPFGQGRYASGDDNHDNTPAQASWLPLPIYSSKSKARYYVGVIIKIPRQVRTPNRMHPKNQGVKLRASSGQPSAMKHRMVRTFHHAPALGKIQHCTPLKPYSQETFVYARETFKEAWFTGQEYFPESRNHLQYITNVGRHEAILTRRRTNEEDKTTTSSVELKRSAANPLAAS